MIVELLLVFFLVLLLGFILWALIGLIHIPVFSGNMVSFLFASDDGEELEGRVRSYGWLREGKGHSGRLVIVDCGLSAAGLDLAQRLRKDRVWLDYCPYQALTDYTELLQHCLEKEEEL